MTTRTGKVVYPNGPHAPKYARDDSRYQADPHPFSGRGGYVHVNRTMPTRRQRRLALKAVHFFQHRDLAVRQLVALKAAAGERRQYHMRPGAPSAPRRVTK